jgi:hypothetical protein
MAVSRPVAPIAVIGTETVWRAILMPLVVFGLKAVNRTIMVRVTPGVISPAAVPFKFANRRFIPFLKVVAAVLVKLVNRRSILILKVASSFALGP